MLIPWYLTAIGDAVIRWSHYPPIGNVLNKLALITVLLLTTSGHPSEGSTTRKTLMRTFRFWCYFYAFRRTAKDAMQLYLIRPAPFATKATV